MSKKLAPLDPMNLSLGEMIEVQQSLLYEWEVEAWAEGTLHLAGDTERTRLYNIMDLSVTMAVADGNGSEVL